MQHRAERVALVAAALALCGAVPIAQAEEEAPTEYAYGTVEELNDNRLIVSEYDYATETHMDVAYTVDPTVKLEDVTALGEIAAGDLVDIDYVVTNGERVALAIAVEKPGSEELLEPEEDDL